jgi:TnpA family transposase
VALDMESEANCGSVNREGQEDQLGALGLVLNVTVLWNTIYIEAALEQLRQDAQPVHESGLKALNRVTSSSP